MKSPIWLDREEADTPSGTLCTPVPRHGKRVRSSAEFEEPTGIFPCFLPLYRRPAAWKDSPQGIRTGLISRLCLRPNGPEVIVCGY